MKRFKNILLIFDEGTRGEPALIRAATLAQENRAQLTAVEVMRELPADMPGEWSAYGVLCFLRTHRSLSSGSGKSSWRSASSPFAGKGS